MVKVMMIDMIMVVLIMLMAIVIIVDKKVTWSAMELLCTDGDFIGRKG